MKNDSVISDSRALGAEADDLDFAGERLKLLRFADLGQGPGEALVGELDDSAALAADQVVVAEGVFVMAVAVDEGHLADESAFAEELESAEDGGPADGFGFLFAGQTKVEFVCLEVLLAGDDLFEDSLPRRGQIKSASVKVSGKNYLFGSCHKNLEIIDRGSRIAAD